jgi:ADP-ribose pyrophosphatase YjhB (NUDIX family)
MPFLIHLWRLQLPRFTVGVVGVVGNDQGQVLLLEHVFHLDKPWGLPGGWIDKHETPDTAVAREILEETGLFVSVTRQLLATTNPRMTHLDFAYFCRPQSAVTHLSGEILAYTWADPSDMPPVPKFHRWAIEAALPDLSAPR